MIPYKFNFHAELLIHFILNLDFIDLNSLFIIKIVKFNFLFNLVNFNSNQLILWILNNPFTFELVICYRSIIILGIIHNNATSF